MTKFASKQAYLDNNTNVLLPDNITKAISPSDVRTSYSDLFDTLIGYSSTVADLTTLSGLVLGTDFKENDVRIVTDIGEGALMGVYRYLPDYSTSIYSWVRIGKIGDNQIITATESSLANYITNEWTDGDLAIWDIVKTSSNYIYLLTENNGSVIGNYQLIYSQSLSGIYYEKATATLRDAMVLDTDFIIGDYCKVADNGYGQVEVDRYLYDNESSSYKWVVISKYTDIIIG